jgi:purine-cytosine permease-like protein
VFLVVPLVVPLFLAAAGGALTYLASTALNQRRNMLRSGLLASLCVLAAIAAVVPNAGQTLYSSGLSFPSIEVVNDVSYFIFGACFVGAWRLLSAKWQRWLLTPLILVSFAQPLLWTCVLIGWRIGGFAP